jgi:hypothetical protein
MIKFQSLTVIIPNGMMKSYLKELYTSESRKQKSACW